MVSPIDNWPRNLGQPPNTHNHYAPQWRGHVDMSDPFHLERHLRDGEPDPARYPVHRVGTWQRAMLFLSLGYRPDPVDVEDLTRWSRLGPGERKAEISRNRRTMRAITTAASKELKDGEVLASTALAHRLSGYPGVPGIHPTKYWLRTLPPAGETGPITGGKTGLYRIYYHYVGAPGHFFATDVASLREFMDTRRERLAAQGRRNEGGYMARRRRGPDGRILPATDERKTA